MKQVRFYHTKGCHLCEKAMQIAEPIATAHKYVIQAIDIIDTPELVERYATSIPVMHNVATEQKLFWPFNEQDVLIFFGRCSSDGF